jgi:hypothetical protein
MESTKVKSLILLLSLLFLLSRSLMAQVVQGDNLGSHKSTKDLNLNTKNLINASGLIIGAAAFTGNNTNIALEISGTNKALLLPRVASLPAIAQPIDGMLIYSSADNRVYVYQGNTWVTFSTTTLPNANILVGDVNNIPQAVSMTGDVTLSNTGVSTIGTGKITAEKFADASVNSAKVATSTVAGIDIAAGAVTSTIITDANVTSAKIAASAITKDKLADNSITAPKINNGTATSRFLTTSGTGVLTWTAQTALSIPVLTDAKVIVGNASAIPAAVTLTGDITINNTGTVSIGANKVTSAKILDGTVNTANLSDNSVTAVKMAPVVNNTYLTTTATGTNAWAALPVEEYAVGDVKAWLPNLVGTSIPPGWVECNGQTLSYTGSTLNGKVIPNLNNNNYMIGNTSTVTTTAGTSNLTLARSNLPNATFTGNTPSGSTLISGNVTGTVTVNNDAGHSHSITDPGHSHGRLPYFGAGWKSYGVLLSTDRNDSDNSTEYSNSSTTGISLFSVGNHNHTAAFNGNEANHTHSLTLSSINGGVTQTPVQVSPASITVRWIMRVI